MRLRSAATGLLGLLLVGCSAATPSPPGPVNVPVIEQSPNPPESVSISPGAPAQPAAPDKPERPWQLLTQVVGELSPGDGMKALLLYQREADPAWEFYFHEQMRLEVREGGPDGRPVDDVLIDGNKLDELQLIEFTPGQRSIVLRFRQEAISDHTAAVSVWSWADGRLNLTGRWTGWLGWSYVTVAPEVVVAAKWTPPHSKVYSLWETGLDSKPGPKLIRKERVGWLDGKLASLGVEQSRLAYELYNEKKPLESPLDPGALSSYEAAMAHLRQKEWQAAAEQAARALQLTPDYPDALAVLAEARMMTGDPSGAKAAAQQAVELNPWHGWAEYWLGRARLASADPQGAQEALWIAAALLEQEPDVHRYLGEAFERLGRLDKAHEEYQRSLALNPDQPDVRKAIVRIH